MKRLLLLLALIPLICCVSMNAQTVEPEAILLPVWLRDPLNGAHGSVWKTELWIRNDGEAPIRIGVDCNILCPEYFLPPGAAQREPNISLEILSNPGEYLLVDSRYAGDLQVSLRIRDLSRQTLSFGTELPVVRRSDLRVGKIGLLDVPLEDRFRQTLRLYSMSEDAIVVTVAFFETPSLGPTPALATRSLTITPATFSSPGYAQLLDFVPAVPELSGHERVYVEIRSDSPLPFWGFISATNDETQHVTTITPR